MYRRGELLLMSITATDPAAVPTNRVARSGAIARPLGLEASGTVWMYLVGAVGYIETVVCLVDLDVVEGGGLAGEAWNLGVGDLELRGATGGDQE
jgi:hypothetical protein